MAFKKNNPGCGSGGDCGCGPCCSGVWALVRAMYSHFKHTYTGNDVTLLSPSPYVTEFDLVESVVVSGVTQYYCNASGGGNETLINTPDWYGPTADPRIIGQQGTVDPGTGLYPYLYGLGSVACRPISCAIRRRFMCSFRSPTMCTKPLILPVHS